MKKFAILLILVLGLCCSAKAASDAEAGVCFGTTSGMSVGEDRVDHYLKMFKRYANCTVVKGNLEITGLVGPNLNVSFLQNIEEITGYLLIAVNYIPWVPLDKLKVIRGRELLWGNYSVVISNNYNKEDPLQGMKYLKFKSLTEIVRGGVLLDDNPQLCFADKVDWKDILNPAERKKGKWKFDIDKQNPKAKCSKCHPSCDGLCWGPGPDMCQTLTSVICSPSCDARCRGPGADDCCNSECAVGCTGPKSSNCLVCMNVNNSGSCEPFCPPEFTYDNAIQRLRKNPHYKFHFHDQCVDECPSNLLVEENSCVKSCRKNWHNDGSGKCVQCPNNNCHKECDGIGLVEGTLADETTVDSRNVDSFRGCNVIKGNLIFYSYVFTGDSHTNLPPLSIQNLTEAFKDVKVITGYLHIVAWPPELHDFSVFKHLERIDGMDLYKDVASLVIQDSISEGPFYLQNITSLGFTSLKTIAHGNVYIGYCSNLCYDRRVDWSVIIKAKIFYDTFPGGVMLRKNKPDDQCWNETCSAECKNGCWGAGPSQCVACNNFSYKEQCIPSCLYNLGIYEVPGKTECASCDSQCKFSCFGPGPGNCSECRNLMHNGECVERCPENLWPDTVTGMCQKCHNSCAIHGGEDRLCSGPNNTLGEGGCNFCDFVKTTTTLDQYQCLPLGQNKCPDSYYQLKRRPTDSAHATCMPCFTGCRNCSGFRKEDCFHHVGDPDLVPILVPVVLLALAALAVFLVCHYRRKQTLKKRQRSMRVLGIDPQSPEEQYADPRARLMEPMTPSGVAPNQAQLRIVKEAELRIGKILGSGAFGTVHKGYWIPDLAPRERVKVPVAIKVLRDESSQVASNEILDEAFVMASCEHPNLVRLLGISLSHQIMLITQLMPLGNLLEYVRDNKDNIGSQHLLNWCLQITKGMRYLSEEKHLVHRDLAARNVLVKSPNHVRITDFGLAKLLDVNEDAYKAEGGKMPIKWLALESIQHRIFTQKSDVWSFGVTMWELMTFGKKPYEYVPAADVHILLEKGERLPQPHICTIDIYMLLIKCWTVDAEARPTFKELCEDLSKMARDPQRYLVVDNDGALNELPSPDTAEFLRTLAKEDNDDFPITDAEEYLHPQAVPGEDDSGFQLQHAPNMVPWKRQQQSSTSSQQPLLGIRSGSGRLVNGFDPRRSQWNSTSGYDRRLDSVQTTMTNLSSVSGSLPNGASTPFASVTNPLSSDLVCEGDDETMIDDVTLHPPFMHGPGGSVFNPRTISESSDVFTTMPMHPKRGDDTHPDMVECVMPDPRRGIRSREDSSTLRYSAEPVAMHRHETKPNGPSPPKANVHFEHDEDGYLSPAEAANKKPEYFDTREFPPSPTSLFGPPNVFSMAPPSASSVANPEYEATFPQTDRKSPRKSAVDEAGYEVPFSPHDITSNLHNDNVEYENTQAPPPATPSALSANHEAVLTLRHSSQSGESSTSEKRDSGMQSDEDEPKKRPSAVANPIYVTTGHVMDDVTPASGQREDKTSPDYVNVCVDKGFKDDDIFTLLDEKKGAGLGPGVLGVKGVEGPVTRTYSEPDSGVGIEVAVDNLLYHKLGD